MMRFRTRTLVIRMYRPSKSGITNKLVSSSQSSNGVLPLVALEHWRPKYKTRYALVSYILNKNKK